MNSKKDDLGDFGKRKMQNQFSKKMKKESAKEHGKSLETLVNKGNPDFYFD